MRAELICVGTELLLGQIANTNAQFIGQKLSEIGVDLFFCTAVGDNEERIMEAMIVAESRADIIIFSGGLGPTVDDLTKEAIAKHLGVELVIYPPAKEKVIAFFEKRKLEMPENNMKQALIFQRSTPLENKNGFAIGCALNKDGKYYLVFPGPPVELKCMFVEKGMPYLTQITGEQNPIQIKILRFFGLGESNLEDAVRDIIDGSQEVFIAPLLDQGEVTLRLTIKASSEAEANQKFAPIVKAILSRIGEYYTGEGTENLPTRLVQRLTRQKYTIGSAESFTGGSFLGVLTAISGASEVVRGGFVTYTNEMKQQLLGVAAPVLEQEGAVSQACAAQMASGVIQRLGTDIAVSFTGVAGPSMSEGKAVGTTFIGFQFPNRHFVKQVHFTGSREMVRARAIYYACAQILKELEN